MKRNQQEEIMKTARMNKSPAILADDQSCSLREAPELYVQSSCGLGNHERSLSCSGDRLLEDMYWQYVFTARKPALTFSEYLSALQTAPAPLH